MANRFLTAAKAAMNAFGGTGKRPGPLLDPAAVSWGDAVIGVAILIVVTAIGIVAPAGGIILQFLPQLFDILLVSVLTMAVPFVVLIVCAVSTGQHEKLPLLVLFTALTLLLINLTSFALSFLNISTSSALIAVTSVFVGRAANKALGFSLGMSILVGAITGAGIFAASLVLLALPTGQAMIGDL